MKTLIKMPTSPDIVIYCILGLFSVMLMISIIICFERIYISLMRRNFINRHHHRFNVFPFLYYRNNIVDIDNGTDVCSEIEDNEYKINNDNNILYENGIIDIESGTDNDEEFKDLNEQSIRYPILV
jgi:hypothetical protein